MHLQELLAAQGGVVTLAQLQYLGVPERQTRPGGAMTRVRRGAYARTHEVTGADVRQLTALQVAAARLLSDVDLVAAGETAAVLHGLPVLGRPGGLRLVELKTVRQRHHGGSVMLDPRDVVLASGIPATSLARTVSDVARHGDLATGTVTADAALRRGLPRAELLATVDDCAGWPGARRARQVAHFADGLAESPLESLGRVRFHEHGLEAPALQVELGDRDGMIARVDAYWAAHRTVAEADGALKYASAQALFQEKCREDRLREAGYEVVRYTWDEAWRRPTIVVARVLRAFARADRAA